MPRLCGMSLSALEFISRPEDIAPERSRIVQAGRHMAGCARGRTRTGDMMSSIELAAGDRIIEPMIALAGCSTQQRIVVAGTRSIELMLELQRRGFLRTAATANCGHPAAQYDAALVDWRRRTLHALEPTLDWLTGFLSARAVLVVWLDAQKPAASQSLRTALEQRGFVVEQGIVHQCGCALSARRSQAHPLRLAA